MNDAYYVPSNRLPAGAVVLAVAFALAAIIPAWLYAWLTLHSPLLLLDWFALLAFALGMGAAAQLAARLGKARNPLWMGRLGLLIGVSGWYAQWAAWLAVAEADSFVSLFGDPHGMWRFASFVVDSEVRTIARMRIESSVLVASWLIELILLISLPRSMARAAAEAPFCEASNEWMTSFELPRRFAWIGQAEVLVHRLETAPGQLLSILEPCNEEQPDRYSAVTLHCGGTDPFLSIDNVRVSRRANKEKRRVQPVIAYLRLPGMDAGQLLGDGTGLVSTTSTMPASA